MSSPTKASFTSLSTKVGEIVGELHIVLNAILSKPATGDQADVRVAVLKLAARLASCSPYGRMKRSLAEPLAKAILTNLGNEGAHEPKNQDRLSTSLSSSALFRSSDTFGECRGFDRYRTTTYIDFKLFSSRPRPYGVDCRRSRWPRSERRFPNRRVDDAQFFNRGSTGSGLVRVSSS